jgi:hypothetical protein
MKKVYIINPMVGRSLKDILDTTKKITKLAEVYLGEEVEVIDNHFVAEIKGITLEDLSRHIGLMADADIVVSFKDWFIGEYWNEVAIEEHTARRFGKTIIEFDAEFIAPDCMEIYRERCNVSCTTEVVSD